MKLHLYYIYIGLLFISMLFIPNDKMYSQDQKHTLEEVREPLQEYAPKKYACPRTNNPIHIDGKSDEEDWEKAQYTDYFVDIEGEDMPSPGKDTRVKMLWDSTYLYVFALMEEPHVWGKIKQRDEVIFYDDDFEVFIDTDGDTHGYGELEINALGTVWDLMLTKPYRDGGKAITNWDISGLKTDVHVNGTINNSQDTDEGWSAEIAIPWKALFKLAGRKSGPQAGDRFRVNFSRVDWEMVINNGVYEKKRDDEGDVLPARNWVWSPQGVVDMHRPETWGFVRLVIDDEVAKETGVKGNGGDSVKWLLRRLYYRQKQYYDEFGMYASELRQLKATDFRNKLDTLILSASNCRYTIKAPANEDNTMWIIREDGLIEKVENCSGKRE